MDAAFVSLRPPLPFEHARSGAEAAVFHRVAFIRGAVALPADAHHRGHRSPHIGNLEGFLKGDHLVRGVIAVIVVPEFQCFGELLRLVVSDSRDLSP